MPIFEYTCQKCGKEFEEIVLGNEAITCPACGSADTEKLISRAVFRTGGPIVAGSPSANAITSRGKSGCAGCTGGNCSTC
ncbi:MAG: zinc ribbon domain-containing protein [Desulfovibrionales bacterium]|nr:zinc ribbon domain-containing protein [Desulfovibrionales bacterium]